MSRITHIIPILFLWFAGLAVIAHMVVPHDHHLYDTYSYSTDKCPAPEKNTGHGPGIPVHCNTLNDLASEKALKYLIQDQLKFQDIIPGIIVDHSSLLFETYFTLLTDIQVQLPDLISFTSSPFRAPPFLG